MTSLIPILTQLMTTGGTEINLQTAPPWTYPGLIVFLLTTNIGTLVYFNRAISTGKLRVGSQADAAVVLAKETADQVIQAAEKQQARILDMEKRRGDEWKATAEAEKIARDAQAEIAAQAVRTSQVTERFFGTYVPPLGDKVDNGREEGSK